jgi:hypothetical protein
MPGWMDRLSAAIYQRGRSLTEVSDRVAEEKRAAIRTVRDALLEAMTHAEQDRERGGDDDRAKAMAAAQLASTTVLEVDDDEVRSLIADWRGRFDAIPKGWMKLTTFVHDERDQPGYPEPAWSELREAADAAHDRLGALLRGLLRQN